MDLKEIMNKRKCFSEEVTSLDMVPVTTKTGFLSDITTLTVHLANGEEAHLLMKSPLKSSEKEDKQMFSEISTAVNVFELDFYEKIYPELEQMMIELHLPSPLPKCYYAGATADGPVFVFEDLKRRGLQLPPLETDLSENDLLLILRSLARLQAGACALQLRRQASLLELFPFLKQNGPCIEGLQELCEKNTDLFKQLFITECPKNANLAELVFTIGSDTGVFEHFYTAHDADFLLSHGDLWNNNVFINDKECVIIDWQCISGGNPMGDIAMLLGFAIDLGPEPSKRLESHVQFYLKFLLECCGEDAALREMVKQRVIPFMSDDKMVKLSLQFVVKIMIACYELFLESETSWFALSNAKRMKTRIFQNLCNIFMEFSR